METSKKSGERAGPYSRPVSSELAPGAGAALAARPGSDGGTWMEALAAGAVGPVRRGGPTDSLWMATVSGLPLMVGRIREVIELTAEEKAILGPVLASGADVGPDGPASPLVKLLAARGEEVALFDEHEKASMLFSSTTSKLLKHQQVVAGLRLKFGQEQQRPATPTGSSSSDQIAKTVPREALLEADRKDDELSGQLRAAAASQAAEAANRRRSQDHQRAQSSLG